ncbi:hypothetical protein FB567DRAFT_620274 [Paraphoma chrysanthemicola]|uniref:Uncharacterized protein n=1 Tax=Paraphoma chrysanthemicola TaxID=798071 RepID=A0A8K0R967_9PLEO|nr:hypothetical protein FB567DRAFT_620274 [Paraphoma chrysanthemicola]
MSYHSTPLAQGNHARHCDSPRDLQTTIHDEAQTRKLLRHTFLNASSWFDLYPPTSSQNSQTPPILSLDPKLRARLMKLTSTPEDIKPAITSRKSYLNHLSMKGKYCSSCTSSSSPAGSCGPTCTLLRSSNRRAVPENISDEWTQNATESLQIYERLVREVSDATQSQIASQAHVEKWEHDVEEVRNGTLNESEKREEKGWPVGKAGRGNVKGMKLDWGFDGGYEGQGNRGEIEEIAPEEVG